MINKNAVHGTVIPNCSKRLQGAFSMSIIYHQSIDIEPQMCSYGCGNIAKYQTKTGKLLCNSHHTKCPALVAIKEASKKIVGDDGLTTNQRKAIKTAHTKRSTINNDGININQSASQKTTLTKKLILDEHGRNLFVVASLKAVKTLKSQIDEETGLSKFDLLRSKRQTAVINIKDTCKPDQNIFLPNKYTKWYFNIIENAKRQNRKKKMGVYYERHHIIPKSLGGSNQKNLIPLTSKEHYICHLLLTKMTFGNARHKMLHAFTMMCSMSSINCRLYETAKKSLSKIRSNKMKGTGICVIPTEVRRKNSSGHDRSYAKNNKWVMSIENNIEKLIHKNQLSEYIADGYIPGMLPRVWVYHTLSNESKRILEAELPKYKSIGFELGRYI
jgi:hypothetical protein